MTKVLVTGFSGCIGAATVERLLESGVDRVVGFSRSASLERVRESHRARIEVVRGDIASEDDVLSAVRHHEPTHIIHLAAYQTPDCQAQPFRGMRINVGGTSHLFRAAAEVGSVQRFVFASSAAVYGPRALYEAATIVEDAPFKPSHLYGYWKVCGEGMAQAFHSESNVATVSLRIATTYGPGRDQGMTSAPTTAIKAVALGVPYEFPYSGGEHYHYVADVACAFCEAALGAFEGNGVFNVRGETVPVSRFLELLRLEAEAQGLPFLVSMADEPMDFPFACDLDESAAVATFPRMTRTALEVGIRESLLRFREMVERRALSPEMIR